MNRPALGVPKLQLEQLGARERNAYPACSEVDQHVGLVPDLEDTAEAILVVCHQVTRLVGLSRFLDDGDIEGTTRQVASPSAGACWFHFTHSTRIPCLASAMADSSFAALSMPDPLA